MNETSLTDNGTEIPQTTEVPTEQIQTPVTETKTEKTALTIEYTDFKAPEGYKLDKAVVDGAVPIFKDLGLNQDQAQRLVDFHAKSLLDAAKAPQEAYEGMRAKWRSEVTGDQEISRYAKDGRVGIEAVKLDIGRALGALNDQELVTGFREAMDLTGAGDNPAFVKAFWKLSQRLVEGSHVAGAAPSVEGQRAPGQAVRPSAAKSLYPNLA